MPMYAAELLKVEWDVCWQLIVIPRVRLEEKKQCEAQYDYIDTYRDTVSCIYVGNIGNTVFDLQF